MILDLFAGDLTTPGLASGPALMVKQWLPLTLGVLVIAILGRLATRWLGRGRQRQWTWRIIVVSLLLLLVSEVTGVAHLDLGRWLGANQGAANEVVHFAGVTEPAATPIVQSAQREAVVVLGLATLWLGGALALLGRLVWVSWELHVLRRGLRPCTAATALQRVQQLTRRLGLARSVQVAERAGLCSPLVFGWRRPVLVLPEGFEGVFATECQEAVLAHELGHVLNNDTAWHLLAEVTTSLLWWHPAAWWCRRQLVRANEAAADEATLCLDGGPQRLAESLVAMGRRLRAGNVRGSWAAAGLKSDLALRVQALLHMEGGAENRVARGHWLAAAVAVPFIVVLASCASCWARPANDVPFAQRTWASANLAWAKSSGALMIGTDAPIVRRRIEPVAGHPEALAISELRLTQDQEQRFWVLRAEIDAATLAMHELKEGRVERGREIGQRWNGGLKEILTPEQYEHYCEYWRQNGVRRAMVARRT